MKPKIKITSIKKVGGAETPSTFNDINGKSNNTAYARMLQGFTSYAGSSLYNVDKEAYDLDVKRNDVIRNKYTTEEELQKQRAKNQSIGEQFFNFLEQAVVGEVILGSVKGLTDIADMVYNGIAEIGSAIKGEERLNDYTNPISLFLENLKNQNEERFAIHQANPGQAFALGDSGWWFNGLTTVASTASLLIPTLTLSKGLSLVGKGMKMARLRKAGASVSAANRMINAPSRVSTGLAKALGSTTPYRTGKMIDLAGQIGFNAVVQRSIENWQEAREVYNSTYEDALNRYRNLDEQQKVTFFANNPNLLGKNDEEIAEYIASSSASKTFWNDYWMLLMDIPQFAGISAMWRGVRNKAITGNLDLVNRNAAKRLGAGVSAGVAGKNLTEATELGRTILSGNGDDLIKNNFINRIKSSFRRPLTAFGALELTEGVEEGYQGIQIEKGKEIADLIFDPSTPERTLDSYLSDPNIWDQAFWGVIGGIGFKAVGQGLGNLERKIKDKSNKDLMSEEDYAKSRLTDEKIRELEILGRYNTLQELATNLDLLSKNKNPYKRTADGKDYETIDENEVEAIRSTIVQDFITKLTLDAVDAGNYELLTEFVNAPEFTKYLKESDAYDSITSTINTTLLNKMEVIEDRYRRYLSQSIEYSSNENPWVANLIARLATRKSLTVDDLSSQINDIEKELNVSTGYLNNEEWNYYKKVLFDLDDQYQKITQAFVDGKITRQAYDAYLDDFKEELKIIRDSATLHIPITNTYSSILSMDSGKDFNVGDTISDLFNAFNDVKKENPTIYETDEETKPNKEQQELTRKKINLSYLADKHEAAIPKTDKQFKKLYNEFERHIIETAKKKFENAKEIVKRYLNESENIDVAKHNVMNNENLPTEVSEALDLLKIGYDKTADLWQDIMLDAFVTSIARQQKQEEEQQTHIDGEVVNNQGAEQMTQQLKDEFEKHEVPEPTTPPTGNQESAPPIIKINPEPQAPSTPELKPEPELKVRDDVPIPKIDIVNQIAQKVSSYILQNIKGDIGIYINDIVENGTLDRETYNQLFELLKSNINIVSDEETIAKGIKHGIGIFLQLKISALQKRDIDVSKEFKIAELLLDKDNLASEFGVINILPVEERGNLVFEALNNYLNNIGQIVEDKTVINLIEVFNTIIRHNPNITYYQLLDVYKVLDPYISNGVYKEIDGKKITFIFDERSKSLYRKGFDTFLIVGVNNENFTDKTQVRGLRMALPSKRNREEAQKIINQIREGKLKDPKIRLRSNTGKFANTLSIIYTDNKGNVVELGRIPKVEKIVKEDGTTYIKNIHSNGLMFNIEESSDELNSNFDELFGNLHDAQESRSVGITHDYITILEMIERAEVTGKLTDSDFDILMSLDEIKRLYDEGHEEERYGEDDTSFNRIKGGIVLEFNGFTKDYKPYEGTKAEQAYKIIKYISGVLRNKEGVLDFNNIWLHFIQYKQYVYENYAEVYEAQESIKQGNFVDISLTAADANVYILGEELTPVRNIVEENYDNFPIFKVDQFGNGVTEDGQIVKSDPRFEGKIGIVFQRGNTPFTSMVENRRLIDTSSTIVDDLRTEIKTIIEGFLTKKEGYSFEETSTKLTKLLSGNTKLKLFSRIVVTSKDGILYIQPYVDRTVTGIDEIDTIAALNKYGSNKDRLAAQQPGAKSVEKPWILTKKAGEDSYTFRTYNEDTVNKIVDNILEHIKFNFSDIAFTASEVTKANNPYFYKEDGKLIIEIGGVKREYKSYAELLYKEDALMSYVTFNELGQLLSRPDSRSEGIPIAITKRKIDKHADVKRKRTLTQLLNVAKRRKGKNMTITELLQSVELEGLKSLLVTGEWHENTVAYDLVDTSISVMNKEQINKHKNAYFIYNVEEDVTYINPEKFKNLSITSDIKIEIIRGLVHERLHKLFAQAKEGNPLRTNKVIKELLDTYNLFRERLINETDNPLAKAINSQFKSFLDKYVLKDNILYIDGKIAREVDIARFVEEWLVESFTQPVIMQFNNEKEVTVANVENLEEENKTIFQRIIDCIIKLFNIIARTLKSNNLKIKNNTILAKQYLLLSKEISDIQNEEFTEEKGIEEKENEDKKDTKAPIKPEIPENDTSKTDPVVDEQKKPVERKQRRKREKNFDLTSEIESAYPMIKYDVKTKEDAIIQTSLETPIINPYQVITINNMNEFTDLFNSADKLKIATLIENGEINYLCQ